MEQQKKGLVYDRWSVVFVLFIAAVPLSFILLKLKGTKASTIPFIIFVISLVIVAFGSARIRRNDYKGQIYYKGENDCGFSQEVRTKIDGVKVRKGTMPPYQEQTFKAPNGTDIKIDEHGNVSYVGFGSKLISNLRGAGYLPQAPDECWK